MSYDFSFSPKTLIAIVFCLVGLLLITFFAGFFTGVVRLSHSQVIPDKFLKPDLQQLTSKEKSAPKAAAPTPVAGTAEEPVKQSANPEAAGKSTTPGAAGKQEDRHYCLQFGDFEDKTLADQQIRELAAKGVTATETSKEDAYQRSWFVVRMGSFDSFDEASQAADGLRTKLSQPVLVRPADSL
jgi:cell division protein FtsN